MNSNYDWTEILILGVVAVLVSALVLVCAAAAFDGVQSYRSFPERTACELHQMQPRRRDFSAYVVCVPYPMRRDTLALERGK